MKLTESQLRSIIQEELMGGKRTKNHVTLKVNEPFNVSCNGLWMSRKTNPPKTVIVKKIDIFYEDYGDDDVPTYINVYFSPKEFSVEEHGLIYTDPGFLRSLKTYLKSIGLSNKAVNEIDYTEQGMQGDDYVSLEAGYRSTDAFFKEVFAAKRKVGA